MNAPVEIINIAPRTGAGAIVGPSCEAAAALAAAEMNEGTGILGREVCVTTIDGGGPPQRVADEVSALLATGMVHAITGIPMPENRSAVTRAAAGRAPCVFGVGHDGLDPELPGVFMIGEHPGIQTLVAVNWLYREFGARRWAVVASEYGWSRRITPALRTILAPTHEIVAEHFVPLGATAFDDVLGDPRLDDADGVILLLVGGDAARFNRAFTRAGRADRQFRTGPTIDENVLLAGGLDANRNIYVPSRVIPDRRCAGDRDLLDRYRRLHRGFAPTFSRFANGVYRSLHALRAVADATGSFDTTTMHRTLADRPVLESAVGTFTFRGDQIVTPTFLTRAAGADFETLDLM
ncbi:ABC transporter substrate-binding protein [Nocardia puris]|uniref:ABC-type branched-subunit amino acid transport system substrate-binding protein n=1 Tax=Nocardia puris TaxID=208602 RepID=A0A366DCL1_9NOCA|nr:ABC transporter substrate-binding protein [Nocardia puris]MBF6211809.1 ABC transporter substrate-binding protein [Nocardia puris]MBF6365812.1 ABC transporter substrate-binding protein [Nocardia puris]MBF6460545.1 ABC transporter substrate-binding protein [Nocardia puris]RBO86988.1 ABC-type branched-subunit amino acid transport system substrate-binding protein [Nocardia puris]